MGKPIKQHVVKKEEFSEDVKAAMREMQKYQDRPMSEEHKKMFIAISSGNYNYQYMKYQINIKLHQIKSYLQVKERNQQQINGEIWKTVENNTTVLMTKEELQLENDRLDLMIFAVVNNKDGIKHLLTQMFGYVGQLNPDKTLIDTWDGYEMFLQKINNDIKALVGYGIL
jgi:hypothetical protein